MRPFFQVPLRYGVIAGVIGLLLVVTLYYLNRHPFLVPVHFDFRIILFSVFLFFSLKEFRDYYQNGELYFWQGLISSFLFVATFAVVASTLIGVFATFVPDFVASYIKLFTNQLNTWKPEDIERVGKEAFERNLKQLPSTNAIDLAFVYFGQSFMIGLFISIILSVVLRKQPKT
jgi:Protein of unknown function (DUF4199)